MVGREYEIEEPVIKDELTQSIIDSKSEQTSSDLQLISNLLISGYPFEVVLQYFETRQVVEALQFVKERQRLSEGMKNNAIVKAQALVESLREEGRSDEYIDEMVNDLFSIEYGFRYLDGKLEWWD